MKFLYGDFNLIPKDEPYSIFNFTSLVEGYQDSHLIPPNNLGAISEYDFDMRYMHYIMDHDGNFVNFMNIVNEIYYGHNVFLIISYNDWSINLVESLLKLIQQRYGINATNVITPDDVYYAEDVQFDSYYGINNFDIDKERYVRLYEFFRVQNTGRVSEEE